jgi:hypothetical protein
MPIQNPPNAADVQSVVQGRIDALASLKDAKETLTVEWRGTQIHIPVISMPIDLLSYNPGTHRIRAQRSTDLAREKDLESEPWGHSAQNYLHNLLMGDPADPTKIDPSFIALKEDLREHSQSDPGIITRTGVLINGNTRRAALKELGAPNIRVGVLPSDAGHEDLQSIELSLQLRKDHRRDYSFMNFLLAIDERASSGQIAAKIQKDFRIKATVFDRSRWILGFVRDAIERSKICLNNGVIAGLSLVEFESHQGKLEELYRAYMVLAAKSSGEAQALREQRLLALVLNKSKTDLRLIEPDFVKKYMKGQLPAVPVASPLNIPGTTLTVQGPDPELMALRQLTTNALQARAMAAAKGGATPLEVAKATNTLVTLDDSLVKALDHAGKQARVVKRRLAAADRVSDACDNLDFAIEAVAAARSTANFDPEDLDEILVTLRSKLEKLAMIVARGTQSTSEGIAWLQSATAPVAIKE